MSNHGVRREAHKDNPMRNTNLIGAGTRKLVATVNSTNHRMHAKYNNKKRKYIFDLLIKHSA